MEGKEAVTQLLERGVGTAIIFIELVHGCNQSKCPSWGTVCKYTDGMHFMSDHTLERVLDEIESCKDILNQFQKVDLWPYGNGDPVQHPQLSRMLKTIHERLPYQISLSVDSNSFIPCGEFIKHTRMKIMHKFPQNGWLQTAERWNREYGGQVQHGVITNNISYNLWQEIMQSGGQGIKKGRTFLTIPFGGNQLPNELPTYRRVSFEIDKRIPVERNLYSGSLAKRTMFKWDGSLRRCLVAGTTARTFRELLSGDVSLCAKCFADTGGELANFHKDKIIVEEFACCVSDRPL